MQITLLHPTGNANVRAAAIGLNHAGLLGSFYTSIATFQGSLLDTMSVLGPFAELSRRRFDESLKNLTRTYPTFEVGRILSGKIGASRLIQHEKGIFSIDSIYRNLDKNVAKKIKNGSSVDAVYAYEDGALLSFLAAKQKDITCLYDLPIGYWRTARRLLKDEHERWPQWAATLSGFKDSEKKLQKKDEELCLADHIFVASKFTAQTLTDFPGKLSSIHIIPYGFPPADTSREYGKLANRRLKLLFVGGLSQRKGIADLFAAVEGLEQEIALTIVGRKGNEDCPALDQALAKHTWIPSLPHDEILKLMRQNDVFVFPSLFEGFGLVITEAMSQGTPVITTDRTAGPDLIQHGENGWLIQGGSVKALRNQIIALLESPDRIALAGINAMQTANKRPWSQYGQELAQAIKQTDTVNN